MSNYRQTHRSFQNHTHHHQQRQRVYNPRNATRRPNYQSSRRHHSVHNNPSANYSFFGVSDSHTATDHHQFQDQTPVSQPPLPDIVLVNNYSSYSPVSYNAPVDDFYVSTELIDQERNSIFSFGPLLYPVPIYLLNDIYDHDHDHDHEEKEDDDDDVLKYLKIRTHYAPAKDEVDTIEVESGMMCAICQSEFEPEENIGTLQCEHEYHVNCIKKWLLNKKDCPMCRALVFPSQE